MRQAVKSCLRCRLPYRESFYPEQILGPLQAGIQLKGDGEPERAWQQWEEQASSLLYALEIARKGEEL